MRSAWAATSSGDVPRPHSSEMFFTSMARDATRFACSAFSNDTSRYGSSGSNDDLRRDARQPRPRGGVALRRDAAHLSYTSSGFSPSTRSSPSSSGRRKSWNLCTKRTKYRISVRAQGARARPHLE